MPRIDLRVLVVDNGDGSVDAIAASFRSTGIPYTRLDLNDPGRPAVTAAFLSDTVNGTPRAKYQGVVLPARPRSARTPAAEHGDGPSGPTASRRSTPTPGRTPDGLVGQ
ncbi:hypothetical protein SGLAM104S_06100 [Streptomyces glaucescens]